MVPPDVFFFPAISLQINKLNVIKGSLVILQHT